MSEKLVIKHKFSNFSVRFFLNKRAKSRTQPFGNSDNLYEYSSLMFEVIRYRQINSRTSLFYRLYEYANKPASYMPYDNYFPVHEFEDSSKGFVYDNNNISLWGELIRREMQTIEAVMQLTSDIPKENFTLTNLKEAHELAMLPFRHFIDDLLVKCYFGTNYIIYPELKLLSELLNENNSYKIFEIERGFLPYFKVSMKELHYEELEQYILQVNNIRNIFNAIIKEEFNSIDRPYITLPLLYEKLTTEKLKNILLDKGFGSGSKAIDDLFLTSLKDEIEKKIVKLRKMFIKYQSLLLC